MKNNIERPLNPIAKASYDFEFIVNYTSAPLVYGLKHDTRDFILDLISDIPEERNSTIPLQVQIWKMNGRIDSYPLQSNSVIAKQLVLQIIKYTEAYKINWLLHNSN